MNLQTQPKVALITGAARRLGKAIAELLHHHGMNIILHYRSSQADAETICQQLNALRPDSACSIAADLSQYGELMRLMAEAQDAFGYLDALINNASAFFPTPFGSVTEGQWQELMDTNVKAPFFLAQLAAPLLKQRRGSIVNIVDIHGEKPLKDYSAYCISKAALRMHTYSLAKELAPGVRVNAISPGAILWPEHDNELGADLQADILKRIALRRLGEPTDIAEAVLFLVAHAKYTTGEVLAVDGGRLLNC